MLKRVGTRDCEYEEIGNMQHGATFQANSLRFDNEVGLHDLLAVHAVLTGQRHDARLLLRGHDHELAVAGHVPARRGTHAAAAAGRALLRRRALAAISYLLNITIDNNSFYRKKNIVNHYCNMTHTYIFTIVSPTFVGVRY